MVFKKINIEDILKVLGSDLLDVDGETNGLFIDNLADVEHVCETTLDWINPSKKRKQEIAESSNARVLLVDETITPINGKVLIRVKDPRNALARIGNYFFIEPPTPYIHPTAIIDKDAIIGEGVYIGPYSIIGKAVIGDNCIIESFVKVYDRVEMGEGCHIYDNVVLGSPGFGLERDADGNYFRFPQLGKVVLGKYVDVGCLTCIDRGALSDTIVGDYTKIDSLCKIAHNNHIGKNVAITGCNSIGGSNTIEDNVWIAPNSSLREWGFVGKGSFIGMGSVVVMKVKEESRVFGNPAGKFL